MVLGENEKVTRNHLFYGFCCNDSSYVILIVDELCPQNTADQNC